jgi:hypothetical protein
LLGFWNGPIVAPLGPRGRIEPARV